MRIDTAEQYRALQASPAIVKSGRRAIPIPCMTTLLVSRGLIRANNYNPNAVSKDKMKLLRQSILDNGFCFPIVTIWDDVEERFVIIDGFHRFTMASEAWLGMSHVPVVVLDHDVSKRMFATVQFNKARGVHQVDLDAELIRALIDQGNSDEEIVEHLGVDLETVHRYKTLCGIADMFGAANWSMSWEADERALEEAGDG